MQYKNELPHIVLFSTLQETSLKQTKIYTAAEDESQSINTQTRLISKTRSKVFFFLVRIGWPRKIVVVEVLVVFVAFLRELHHFNLVK